MPYGRVDCLLPRSDGSHEVWNTLADIAGGPEGQEGRDPFSLVLVVVETLSLSLGSLASKYVNVVGKVVRLGKVFGGIAGFPTRLARRVYIFVLFSRRMCRKRVYILGVFAWRMCDRRTKGPISIAERAIEMSPNVNA